MTGFACQMQVISSKRGTLSPPAFKPIFNVPKETQVYFVTLNIGFMCRCVAYRSGMRTKAMPSACFFLLDILALETVRSPTKDNWKK